MFFYTFMPELFNMSLTASVAIVLVTLLRLLLKKAPKVISYALWGVVLFRLLCPVSIGSNFSVYNLFDAPAQESGTITSVIEYVPSNIVHTEYPSVARPVPGISDAINEALPQGREQLVADPLEAPMSIATYVWMIGVLVMVIYSIVSYIRLRRKLSVVVPLRDNIFIADDIKSPFVVGLFRPKIYLPCNLSDKEQEYIILHEQHHIKRLDHVMKALAFFALAIHWFNPLVWAAFILASKDMEMSCDEAVIHKVGGDVRADYSASLLTLATGRRIIAGTPLAFGEGDTKGRINNLSKWKKPAVWVVLIAVVACIILAVSLLTNPAAKRKFPINGSNVSELDTEKVIGMIARAEKLEDGSQLCVNADNFDLMFTSNFNWANDGAIRYFYTKDQTVYSAQLRMFHDDNKYFITDSDKWIEQEQIFKLFHYLDALKYMPQEEIRQLSPDADGYSVMMRHEGAPSDYERVLKYSQNGVNANDGWYIHLEVQPLHKVEGGGYNGTGDEVIHLFYNNGDNRDDIAGKTYLYNGEGFGGSFTITLYEDGTFTYYEGMLSSYIGTGSFMLDGDTVIMTDDGHGGYGLVNHFRHDGDDLVFIEQDSDNFVYVKVKDGEKFHCTGEAFKLNDTTAVVIKWFDYLETPDEMKWDGSIDINLPEFPDVTFRWTYGEIVAVKGNKTTSLYTGMPIWNTYFCDLTGDGLPEFCSTISWGSGMIDNRVMIYDYANGVSYSLEERGVSDYTLRQNESDGQLYVDKTAHVGGGLLSTGRLAFEDDCLQVLWPEKPNDNISEITDPTDDPNFAYDTAVEKIYEDERNEYFISGLYSQYIIVHYTDGTQEDIVTALNAGRATFADLDKFGIRYWAEPKPNSFDIAENTVAEIGRGTLKTAAALCEEDAGKLLSLVESGTWVETTEMPDQYNDCAINLGGRLLYYSSKNGTLIQYDLSKVTTYSHPAPSGGRYWTLGMAERLFVNNILCEYIDLAYGITDVAAPDDDEELCRFYLTIGAEGVKSIELSMPSSSGGCENADGSLFKKGERIWLENLDGYSDLRGLTITALGVNGEVIWTASIPATDENKGFTHLINDGWEITNIE